MLKITTVFAGKMKKRILFHYMLGLPIGGSDNSLFYHILHLDRTHFEPVVVFNQHSFHKDVLDKMGIETIIVPLRTLNGKSNISNAENNYKDNTPKKFFRIKLGSELKAIIRAFPETIKVFRLVKKYRIDIIHTNFNLVRSRAAILSALLSGIPVIVHNRNLAQLLKIDRLFSKHVKKIICVSHFIKQKYVENGIPEEKCTVIYNGVDLDKFKPEKRDTNSEELIITSIGRLEKWKGQEILVKAAPIVIQKFPDVKFWIIGDGPETKNLESMVEKLQLTHQFKFWGKIENVLTYLQQTKIFVHNSIEAEPFGRVIIEAMACGLPVISTDLGGPKEIIKDGENGFLLSPNNPEILAEKIEFLIKNKKVRHDLGQKSIETVQNIFNIKNTTEKIQNEYQITL